MARKNKSNVPNAPELQQILLESPTAQPPQNPYYPELHTSSTFTRPPPYSDLSSSVSHQQALYPAYTMSTPGHPPRPGPPTIVIQQHAPIQYDRRAEKHSRKVRKFNTEMLCAALLAMILAIYAHSLYARRPCVDNFLVLQPGKDFSITIKDVREAQLSTAYISIFVIMLCFIKCAFSGTKSHGCYLFIMGLTTLIAAIHTGFLAYLTFYTPCTLKLQELAASTIKTLMGSFTNSLPAPERGMFGESNVIQLMQDDRSGALIFFLSLCNFILYVSGFVTALLLC